MIMRKTIKYIIGNPGSGKTTLREKFIKDFFIDDDFYIHDVNNFKDYSLLKKGVSQDEIHRLSVIEADKAANIAFHNEKSILVEATFDGFRKSLQHFRKFKNRGYFIEVYVVPPNKKEDMKRNELREYPTPENKFISQFDFEKFKRDYEGIVGFTQILDHSLIETESLFGHITFYKSFSEQKMFGDVVSVEGVVELDFNSIHFSSSSSDCRVYHKDFVYIVEPIDKVFKYGNIFYSRGVKVIREIKDSILPIIKDNYFY